MARIPEVLQEIEIANKVILKDNADTWVSLEKKLNPVMIEEQGSCHLVVCNFSHLRQYIIKKLGDKVKNKDNFRYLIIEQSCTSSEFHKLLEETLAECKQTQDVSKYLVITGLEKCEQKETKKILQGLNTDRGTLYQGGVIILIMVDEGISRQIAEVAPDLKSYLPPELQFNVSVECAASKKYLIELLDYFINSIFRAIEQSGCQQLRNNASLLNNINYLNELESIKNELDINNDMTAKSAMGINFLKGRNYFFDDQVDKALEYYEYALISLKDFQQEIDIENQEDNIEDIDKWQGIIKYHQSLCHYQKYVNRNFGLQQEDSEEIREAIKFMEEARILWKENSIIDSKFINYYQHLLLLGNKIPELKQIVEYFCEKHEFGANNERYKDNEIRLIIDRGYEVEILLSKRNQKSSEFQKLIKFGLKFLKSIRVYINNKIKKPAKMPLSSYEDYEEKLQKNIQYFQENGFHDAQDYCYQAWLNLLLAELQIQWGNFDKAKTTLEKIDRKRLISNQTRIVDAPSHLDLYICIVEKLRLIHQKEDNILEVYKLKQEKYSVQQQLNQCIFVGPVSLQPKLLAENNDQDNTQAVAKEIKNSQQHKDILQQLLKKARSENNKSSITSSLIVFYGYSGTGKSSLLQAGFIPTLEKESKYNYTLSKPILIKDYTNFTEELEVQLNEKLDFESTTKEEKIKKIMDFFEEKERKGERIFIILDQFEKVLMDNIKIPNDKEIIKSLFRQHIEKCIFGVKIIIALREDNLGGLQNFFDEISINQQQKYSLDTMEKIQLQLLSKKQTKLWLQKAHPLFETENSLTDKMVDDLARKDESKSQGKIKPIELQILGAQLQSQQITNLEDYERYNTDIDNQNIPTSPKDRFIQAFLYNILDHCGFQNRKDGTNFLYEVTQQGNLSVDRKQKLIRDFQLTKTKLEDILEILTLSGLVEKSNTFEEGYQLSHDYLKELVNKQVQESASWWRSQWQDGENLLSNLRQLQKRSKIFSFVFIFFLSFVLSIFVSAIIYNSNLDKLIEKAEISIRENDLDVQSLTRLQDGVNLGSQLKNALDKPLFFGKNSEQFAPILYLLQQENDYLRLTNQLKTEENSSGHIKDIAFSQDGKFLGIVGRGNVVRVWNIDSNELLYNGSTHEGEIKKIALYHDDKSQTFLVTGDNKSKVVLWKVNTDENKLEKISQLSIKQGWVNYLSISQDGNWIVAGNDDFIQLFQRTNKNQFQFDKHDLIKPQDAKINIRSIVFSITGNYLAIATEKQMQLWKVSQTKISLHKTWPIDNITQVAFYPEDKYIATVGSDGKMKLWTRKGNELKTQFLDIVNQDNRSINRIAFDIKGQYLATAESTDIVKVWKVLDKNSNENISFKQLREFKGDKGYDLDFNPKSDLLASVDEEGNINLWRLNTTQSVFDEGSAIKKIDMSSLYKNQFLVLSEDKRAKIWDVSGQDITIEPWKNMEEISYSPQGNLIAGIQSNGQLIVWKLQPQEGQNKWDKLPNFEDHKPQITGFSFSLDEKLLAISHSQGNDYYIQIWNVNQHRKISDERLHHPNGATVIKWSHSSNYLATFNESEAILWDINSYEIVDEHKLNGLKDISFHPQKPLTVILDNQGKVSLFDLNKKEITHQWETNLDNVKSISFSSQGKYLLITTTDGKAKVFNTSGKKMTYLENDSSYLFSADEKRIIGYSLNQNQKTTVTIYNINGGKLGELKHDAKAVKSVGLTSDGTQLIVAYDTEDGKGKIQIWQVSNLEQSIKRGCQNLTNYLKINQIKSLEKECSSKEKSQNP